MIKDSYATAILNILMAKPAKSTDGQNDPALTERADLKEEGVKMYVAPTKEELTTTEKTHRDKINNSTCWRAQEITKTVTNQLGAKITYRGYKSVRKDLNSSICYPRSRYLALFTKMPNADGGEFEEFRIINEVKEDGTITYCRRINLNTGYFSNELIMKEAEKNMANIDPEDPSSDIVGGAMTSNEVVIYFPEIVEKNWTGDDEDGPALVGFGIFENAEPISGEKPFLWGALNNTDAVAKLTHVPLFRKNNFQFFIK